MNENTKIYIVLGVVVVFIVTLIGFNIYTEKQSEKIYNNFETVYNNKEKQIILIGRETCGWCQLFQPILDFYKQKYDFNYNYIDTESLVQKHFIKILDKLSVKEDDFGTPLMAFVQEGQVTEIISGYVDEKKLLEKLQTQEFVSSEDKNILSYLDFESLKKTIQSKNRSVIVVGQSGCSYCIKFKPVLMKISDEQDAKIYYINYDEIEQQEELKEYLSGFDAFQGNWGTPLTIIVENGKIINSFSGYTDEKTYLNYLKNNGIISE